MSPDDPYRSLELDSVETLAWQAHQNDLADTALRDWDGFDALRAAVAPHAARVSVTAPVRRGDHWFRVDSGPLVVAATPTGPGGFSSIPATRRSTGSSRHRTELASPTGSRSTATSRACST